MGLKLAVDLGVRRHSSGSPYDQAVIALSPTVYFQNSAIGPYVEPATYEEVVTGLAPTTYFETFGFDA